MNVIPVINCPDVQCIKKKLEIAKSFLFPGDMIHLDVTDGIFSPHKTWNEALEWEKFGSTFALEVHLMMEHPAMHLDDWLVAGAERVIVHAESVTVENFHEMVLAAYQYHAQIMLASSPETPIEDLVPYLKFASAFQVLAVSPGPAGQPFQPFITEKIRFLREEAPNAIIEVDGGMNPETVALVKAVGADTIVSASYIFDAPDPKVAYESLRNI